jgi:hypothetical protein
MLLHFLIEVLEEIYGKDSASQKGVETFEQAINRMQREYHH